jgi:hypothetical protein
MRYARGPETLSFGHLFFAQAKKSNARATASETMERVEILADCLLHSKRKSRALACGSG